MENETLLSVVFIDKDFKKYSAMNFNADSIKKLQELKEEQRKNYWMTYADRLASIVLRGFPKNYKSWDVFTKAMEKYFKGVEKEAQKNKKFDMEKAMKKAPKFISKLDIKDIRVIFARKNFELNVANSPQDALDKFMLIIKQIKL